MSTTPNEPQSSTPPTYIPVKQKRFFWFLRIMGVLYALLGLAFFFFSNEIFYLMNVGPQVFKITETIPNPTEKFWLVLATSMMAMLSALSFLASESPWVRGYNLVHLLAKTASTAGFLYLFLNENRYFAYLLGVITDASIAVILTWYMIRTAGIKKNDPTI